MKNKPKLNPLTTLFEVQADAMADRVVARLGFCAANGACVSTPASQAGDSKRGQPLHKTLRMKLEQAFNTSLCNVRIHSDWQAARWCRMLGAQAFTVGQDIFFAPGRFAPDTPAGLHLLAHELSHVLQQTWFAQAGLGAIHPCTKLQCKIEYFALSEPKAEDVLAEVNAYLQAYRFPLSRAGGIAANWLRTAFLGKDPAQQAVRINSALQRMHDALEDYGLVDLRDRQQRGYFLAALCDQIIRPQQHPTVKEYSPPKISTADYELALIGRGASITYYLNSLPASYDHSHSILIGEVDPWQGENPTGRGKGYINHQPQMISYAKEQAPPHAQAYFDRDSFANETLEVIAAAKIKNQLVTSVSGISFDAQRKAFKIDTRTKQTLYAKRVVAGMGAGPHRVPEKTLQIRTQEASAATRSIMNLDEFMRFSFQYMQAGELKDKRIIIHGPNAAIDAVERAGDCGIEYKNITWLIGKTAPVLLVGNQLKHANELAKKAIAVEREGFAFEKKGSKLKIQCKRFSDGATLTFDEIDYYVFALGQDIDAEGALGSILAPELRHHLKPFYDINLRLGDNPYETVLALTYQNKNPDRRLYIIGAAAHAMCKGNPAKSIPPVTHTLGAIANSKQFLLDLQPKLEQSDPALAARAGTFFSRYIADSGQYSLLNDEKNAQQADYLAIANWINEQNLTRSKLFQQRIEGKNVGADYLALVARMLPWDSWLRQVNLLTDMAQGRDVQKQMDNQTRTLPPSVIVAPQLGAIRTAMMALNATLPRYITRDANFVGNDRTELQTYLLSKLMEQNSEGQISPAMAAMLVEEFITYRNRLEKYPYGLEADTARRVFDPLPATTTETSADGA